MVDERAHLAQADRHIAAARQHIRKQEQLIERLGAKGYPVEEAENLLSVFVGALNALERHRLLILDRLEMARTFGDRDARMTLSHMAQASLWLAEMTAPEQRRPVVQQQQQIQPKNDE